MKPFPKRRSAGMRWATLAVAALLLVSLECNKPVEEDPGDGNTETGENLDPEEVIEVGIRPTQIRLDTATELDMNAFALTRDGGFYDTVGGTWQISDESIATIDAAGHVVPLGQGEVQVSYSWEGLDAEASIVEIVAPGRLEVTVIDWATGEPIAGVNVGVGTGHDIVEQAITNTDGFATVEGDFEGPLAVTAWTDIGYKYLTFDRVASRQLRLPMEPVDEGHPPVQVQGQIQFDEDEIEPGKVALGLAMPSVHRNPVSISSSDLLADYTELDGYGLSWAVPENVQINGVHDNYVAMVPPSRRAIFAAGGVYDLGVALDLALNLNEHGPGVIFPMMTSNIDDLRVGVTDPIDFPAQEEMLGIDMPLETPLPVETWVDVAPPPAGYYWPDPILVLSWREYEDCGWVATGFGTGNHPYLPEGDPPQDDDDDSTRSAATKSELEERVWVEVHEAARDGAFEDTPSRHFALVMEDGMRHEHRTSIVVSPPTTKDRVRLPDFLDLIEKIKPEVDSWVYNWSLPEGTDMNWLKVEPRCYVSNTQGWNIYMPPSDEFLFPQGLPGLVLDPEGPCPDDEGVDQGHRMNFYTEALALEMVNYQSLINIHDESFEDFWDKVNRRSLVNEYKYNTGFP